MLREQKMIDAIRKHACKINPTRGDYDSYRRMLEILLRMVCRREHFKTAISVYVYDETVEVVFPLGVRDVIRS